MSYGRIYQVHPNLAAWRASRYPVFEGFHRWKLPSIRCDICGAVWGELSISYPQIDASALPNQDIYKGNKVCVMAPSDLEKARKPIADMLPSNSPLPPGTTFGAFRGRHTAGKVEDFNFYLGRHLASRTTFDALRARRVLSVGGTLAGIRDRKGRRVDFVELHLLPRARLAVPKVQKPGQKYCPECGFDQRDLPEPLVIRSDPIPEHEEIFQLVDDPGVKLCTETFAEAVRSLGLTGIEFGEVQVA
jgi:uncharacterized double-CXXCG motif protein